MSESIIKPVETHDDISVVEMLAKKIWQQHYLPIIGQQQVSYMLDKFQSASAIKSQLDEGASYYLLFKQSSPVGYFSYHFETDALFLSKIYVVKELRGSGLGRKAFDFIVEQAKKQTASVIRLTVNKFNDDAIAVYKKLGFKTRDSVVKDIGSDFVMDDFLMEKSVMEKSLMKKSVMEKPPTKK